MKTLALLPALTGLLASTGGAPAQVAVEVTLAQDQFLPSESIPAIVRIRNHSGQTLHFGDDSWLTYSVEGRDGFIVLKSGDPPTAHGLDLESSKVATVHSDLGPYFTLSKPGLYRVIATLNIKEWGQTLNSKPTNFDVIRGIKIWEQEFGMPQTPATGQGAPEVRKYILQQATYLKRLKLYLRVTDADESRVFRVLPLGPMISFGSPQTLLDGSNNLHVLYQDGPRTFNYSVVDPDGRLVARQTHDYVNSAPRMKVEESGKITIVGGARRVASNDAPPAKASVVSADVAPAP
jgi:hypothetical protein